MQMNRQNRTGASVTGSATSRVAGLDRAWLAVVAATIALGSGAAAAQMGPSPVSVSPVLEQEVATGQMFVGTVMPARTSVVGSAVDGRVVEFHVNEGDRVAKGQPLARLLTQTLEIELSAAQADLELRKQELAELEAGSRPEEIEQTQARMLAAKAVVDYWTPRYERTRNVFERRATSEEDLESTFASLEQGKQSYIEAKAAYDLAVAGPRKEKIAQARARMLAQQEAVRRIEDQIEKHTIRAPFDGYVTAERTEVGEWVSKGQPVAETIELSTVDVQVHVLENYVPYVQLGTSARVEIGALPNEVFAGEVARVVPQADLKARTFPVKVRVQNRESDGGVRIKAGMFARVTLPVGKRETALLIPKDAVVLGGPSPMVYAVDSTGGAAKEGKVRPVPVELGIAHEGLIQVRGSLKAGELVVVQGNERLRPGQEVIVAQVQTPGSAPPKSGFGARGSINPDTSNGTQSKNGNHSPSE